MNALSDIENPFGICFNSMKTRYHDLDALIDDVNFLHKDSKVNVFISFESIMNNISTVKDLDSRLLLKRDFPTLLESEIFNICAHYKKFFKGNGLNTNVFMYMTDLESNNFKEYEYNDEYRSFYINKFLNNPKFELFGNKLIETVVPRVKTISDFIPNVYFITSKNVDGSLIPLVISNNEPDRKNFIITNDKFDMQYLYMDNFAVHYIIKNMGGVIESNEMNNFLSIVHSLTYMEETKIYADNRALYVLLMSVLGDKVRSVDGLKGVGVKTIGKYIINGITNNLITTETTALELLLKVIPEELKEQTESNFKCLDLNTKYLALSDKDKFDIINQINDRFDNDSLIKLNNEDYVNYPLMLPELTC